MVTRGTFRGLSRLPVFRQQRVQIVPIGYGRQAREDITQISVWIFAVPLTGHDDRVDDGRALAGIGMTDKEPVLLPNGRRPDGVFDQVVVEARLAVSLMRGQGRPLCQHSRKTDPLTLV